MARIVVAAVGRPVLPDDVEGALAANGEDVQPQQHRPETVLLADMVRTGAGAFLAADRRHAGVEQIAEELPAGRRLVHADAELFRDTVGRAAGRHGARDALQPAPVAGRQMRVGGEHRQRIRRRDEDALADDQVAVAVAVRRGAEVGRIGTHHFVVEMLGVDQIGVRMMPAEIRQRHEIARSAFRRAEPVLQYFLRVGPGHGMHGVEAHAEARLEFRADRVEIEQASPSVRRSRRPGR